MGEETTEQQAGRILLALAQLREVCAKYNDYGSALGAVEESEDIEDDLKAALRSTGRRTRRLVARIKKWEAGDRDALLLASYRAEGKAVDG